MDKHQAELQGKGYRVVDAAAFARARAVADAESRLESARRDTETFAAASKAPSLEEQATAQGLIIDDTTAPRPAAEASTDATVETGS